MFEYVGLLFVALMILLLGNTQQLLEYYGFDTSGQVIKQGAHQAIASGLSKLDGLSFTDRVVTFVVWALIGVVCFSLVQLIGRVYHDFEEEEKVSSNRYVHPSTFRRADFWKQVALDFIVATISLGLLVAGVVLLFAYVLPVALSYSESFLTHASLSHFINFLVGFFMVYVWSLVLAVIFKYYLHRHRLLAR
ncbi:MAG TPA: hypothetical protein VFH39_05000 [Candidatus Saccharimonadales bacterium]|nr:hypothetical protein [Candidatus Saccharimonadales bacterium]